MTPRSEPPPVHTGHVRAYIKREPAKTRGTAQLILALCAEIDRLRARAIHGEFHPVLAAQGEAKLDGNSGPDVDTAQRVDRPRRSADSWASSVTQTAEQPSRVSQVPPGGTEA